jgi:catechol 2,3-dioxygenase-like lactoylglutathione lyase family enzyme
MTVIDHLTLTVRDLARSKAFYRAALAPLGCDVRVDLEQSCGIGPPGNPAFWLRQGEPPTQPMHIAFRSADRKGVDSFHAAALAAGASDNGAPGLRAQYHPTYYGAFVIDPDGHPIEVVCHADPNAPRRQRTAPRALRRKARPAARRRRAAPRRGAAARRRKRR